MTITDTMTLPATGSLKIPVLVVFSRPLRSTYETSLGCATFTDRSSICGMSPSLTCDQPAQCPKNFISTATEVIMRRFSGRGHISIGLTNADTPLCTRIQGLVYVGRLENLTCVTVVRLSPAV